MNDVYVCIMKVTLNRMSRSQVYVILFTCLCNKYCIHLPLLYLLYIIHCTHIHTDSLTQNVRCRLLYAILLYYGRELGESTTLYVYFVYKICTDILFIICLFVVFDYYNVVCCYYDYVFI